MHDSNVHGRADSSRVRDAGRASAATCAGSSRRSRIDTISSRVLLSFGQDREWKRRLIDAAAHRRRRRALDLATGTGDIAFAPRARGARVVGLDVTPRMIELARGESRGTADAGGATLAAFLVGDMLALPFAGRVVRRRDDRLRTAQRAGPAARDRRDRSRARRRAARVCRSTSTGPKRRWIRAVYLAYLTAVGASLGWMLHRDPDTYRYIPASIRRYPGARGVVALMEAPGFATCGTCRCSAGSWRFTRASASLEPVHGHV